LRNPATRLLDEEFDLYDDDIQERIHLGKPKATE